MRLLPDQDAVDLAAMLRGLLGAECPIAVVRNLRERPAEPVPDALWKSLAAAGVLGLAIGEQYGGAGGGLPDLGVFYLEAGRALCPTAIHATVQAGLAIDLLGHPEQKAAWLPGLGGGSLRGTTSLSSARDASIVTPTLRATRNDAGWSLSGTVDFVLDADVADVLVVTARDGESGRTVGLVVDLHAQGVTVAPLTMMGGYRAFAIGFDGVEVTEPTAVLGADAGLSDADLRRIANAGVALLSMDLVGVGEAALQRTVDHITTRHQFGRPIASFQAAQHLIANMHIALTGARLAAQSAVFWIGKGRVGTRETAIARMAAADAAKLITLDAHQLQGGMGYVVETDLHLWSERARVLSTLGGGADIAATWLEEDSR